MLATLALTLGAIIVSTNGHKILTWLDCKPGREPSAEALKRQREKAFARIDRSRRMTANEAFPRDPPSAAIHWTLVVLGICAVLGLLVLNYA